MACCRLTAGLTNEDALRPPLPIKKGCISSLVRQQNVNQGLSYFTLLSESCQGCHSTLMSIFSCGVLSHPRRSAWWISSLSVPLSPLSFSPTPFLVPALSPSFMAYSLRRYPDFGWALGSVGGWGLMVGVHVFFFSFFFPSKLKYSCMCARVAVWERLHVYPIPALCVRMCVCSWLWEKRVQLFAGDAPACRNVAFLRLESARAALFARWCVKPPSFDLAPKLRLST